MKSKKIKNVSAICSVQFVENIGNGKVKVCKNKMCFGCSIENYPIYDCENKKRKKIKNNEEKDKFIH